MAYSANVKGSRANSVDDYRKLNAKKTNEAKYPDSSIYVIRICDSNFYKIGVSQNIARRHRDIESAMPFNIEVLKVEKAKNAYELEEGLHNYFSDKFVKSEWFNLSDKDYMNCLNIINKWQDLNSGKKKPEKEQLSLF